MASQTDSAYIQIEQSIKSVLFQGTAKYFYASRSRTSIMGSGNFFKAAETEMLYDILGTKRL